MSDLVKRGAKAILRVEVIAPPTSTKPYTLEVALADWAREFYIRPNTNAVAEDLFRRAAEFLLREMLEPSEAMFAAAMQVSGSDLNSLPFADIHAAVLRAFAASHSLDIKEREDENP